MGCVPIVWYNSLVIARTGKIIKSQDENKASGSYFFTKFFLYVEIFPQPFFE